MRESGSMKIVPFEDTLTVREAGFAFPGSDEHVAPYSKCLELRAEEYLPLFMNLYLGASSCGLLVCVDCSVRSRKG